MLRSSARHCSPDAAVAVTPRHNPPRNPQRSSGFMSCPTNTAAQLGKMAGYPEYWMNPANSDYQHLIADYVAQRLMATGVDGLMLDNFELVGHGSGTSDGSCDAACAQGGLDLVARLRNAFPGAPIVLNHAPVSALSGMSGGIAFPMLVAVSSRLILFS